MKTVMCVLAAAALLPVWHEEASGVEMIAVFPGMQEVVNTTVTLPPGNSQSSPIFFDVVAGDEITVVLTGDMIEVFENTVLANSPYGVFKYVGGATCYTTPIPMYTPYTKIVNLSGFEAPKTGKMVFHAKDATLTGGKVHVQIFVRRRTILSTMPRLIFEDMPELLPLVSR